MILTERNFYFVFFRKAWMIMRITTLIILIAALHVSARTVAQKVTLSADHISFEEFFNQLKKQTGYSFLLKDGTVPADQKLDVHVTGISLEQLLDQILKPLSLSYKIDNTIVYILKENNEYKDDPPGIIEGKVLNEKGQPLEGASITVKGTYQGAQTDSKGYFRLKSDLKSAIIEVSFTGYESKTVKAVPGDLLSVILKVSTSPLDQVQIIAYGSTSKRLNIGDVSTVNAKTIAEQPVSDPLAALEGRVPGLQITQQSGVPGSAYTVLIRGQNSIANGNNPLYVIDGVPYTGNSISANVLTASILAGGNPLSSINPQDIESIDILKDADATSIYGSRGANGVILITTKMGKAGKTAVDLNVYAGSSKVTRMMPMLNTQQYLEMRREAFKNDGATPSPYVDFDLLSWDTTRYTDWQKSLFGGTAHVLNAEGTVSGGNQNTQFILSGTYNRQTTVFPGNTLYQKGAGHLGLMHTSNDQRFKINFSTLYTSENNLLPSVDYSTQIFSLPPDAPPTYDSTGKLNFANGTFVNPYALTVSTYNAKTRNLLSNMVMSYELFPHFLLRVNAGYSNLIMDEAKIYPLSSLNPTYGYTSGFTITSNENLETWILEPQMEYTLSSKFGNLNILAGGTLQQNEFNQQVFYATGFSSDQLLNSIGAASQITSFGTTKTEYRYEALFTRASYNWKEKYLLNLSARRDGSSRFGPGNQFANFGSISGGWIFSKESFFQDKFPVLSFGKLRTSYGSSGNDQIGDYQYLDSWTPLFYSYQSIIGLQPARLFNADYGWEINKKWEIGMELGFMKDHIYFSGSYYKNRSSNQLVGYPLPSITGFQTVQQNLSATVQNSGWEFILTTRNISSMNFTWTTSLNLTIPESRLISYPNLAGSSYANKYVVGSSLHLFNALQSTGVDPQTGVYTFTDVNKDGTISVPADFVPYKTVEQQYYGGLNNIFQYKNFQLTVFFQFVKQTGTNYLYGNYNPPGMLGNQPTYVLNRWRKPGDHTTTEKYTQDYSSDAYTAFVNATSGDTQVSDASFIRLKNLSFSYQLSPGTVSHLHLQALRFYIQGQNLLTITNFMGNDPENQTAWTLPPLKTLTAGIQITL